MTARSAFTLPPRQQAELARGKRLEWVTIGFLLSIVVVMFLAMGSSQAMKAAWIEDMLSLVPPIAFLVSARIARRPPDKRFPYGYHRAVSIAFLAGALALALFGLIILWDSVHTLAVQQHPSLGLRDVFGHAVWEGWIMLAALAYSALPPLVLGRMKLRVAETLHDKTLKADADMNKADWLTAVAGIGGVIGIGLGWWWADSVAAAMISFAIVKDGFTNMKRVTADLIDRRPTTLEGEESPLPQEVRTAVCRLPWVEDAQVRLREEGDVVVGEVFVRLRDGAVDVAEVTDRIAETRRVAQSVHWRVYEVVVTIANLDDEENGARG